MSTTTLIEQIKDDLGYLKLYRTAEVFAALAEGDHQGDRLSFLAALVAEEAAATRQRRLNARLRFAHFPARRTIEEFDFDFQPSIDRQELCRQANQRVTTTASRLRTPPMQTGRADHPWYTSCG